MPETANTCARLVRLGDAAVSLGYARGYAHKVVPKLLPVYRAPGRHPNSPLVVREDDLARLLAAVTAEPVKEPAA